MTASCRPTSRWPASSTCIAAANRTQAKARRTAAGDGAGALTRRAADSVLVARFRATGLTSRKMMQAFARAVLAVLLAHLSADFPLQPDSILQAKKNGFDGYLAHGAIHLVTVIVALELFTNLAVWSWYPLLLVLGYVASHPVLDYLRQAYLKTRHLQDSTGPFVVDQALHVVTAVGLAWA